MLDMTLLSLVQELFPHGTRPDEPIQPDVPKCPSWPVDLFGYTATIAERSGCYAEVGVVLSHPTSNEFNRLERIREAQTLGAKWAEEVDVPADVEAMWDVLMSHRNASICSSTQAGQGWKRLAMQLLAIADEASIGFGFVPGDGEPTLASVVYKNILSYERYFLSSSNIPPRLQLPHSLALAIPSDRLSVMPKALTPSVGCTLRSMSHNLALLPGKGAVQPLWFIGTAEKSRPEAVGSEKTRSQLNVLVIPYPFNVKRSDFQISRQSGTTKVGYFKLEQGWLCRENEEVTPEKFVKFVVKLVNQAEKNVGVVHAIVFPETALSAELSNSFLEQISIELPNLEFAILGSLSTDEYGSRRNTAALSTFRGGEVARTVLQSKHHRWRLDSNQVKQYQLGRQLDADFDWWEDIDVGKRQIAFGLMRDATVVAALVCEDLARFDPVLPVVNAVGPNLVVALLMDGPQLKERWPGRYATALAEDPGSSILSVTSLGMINLSRRHGEDVRRVIGLWKDATTGATELYLPQGALALTLTLGITRVEQVAMDGRTDGGVAVRLQLDEVWPVAVDHVPVWV